MLWTWRNMAAGLLLAGIVAAGNLRAEDKITKFKNNEVISVQVKKADLDGIEIEIKDAKTQALAKFTLAAAEIADIDWEINDAEWRAGSSAFDGSNFGKAAQHFSSILSDPEELAKFRLAAKPALYFYYAESLYRSGKAGEAVPQFEKLMNEFKNSWYVPKAVGSMVDAAIQTKEFGKVPPLLNQLRTLGGEQKSLADYYEGQMLLAQEKVKNAEERFLSAASASALPATKGMALMGQAQCAIASNNLSKARELAQRALAAGPPASVAGAAHLVIGNAIVAEVDAQKPAGEALQSKLMDALLEYMRVLEQYRGDPRTEPQAMLKAGECLERLYKSAPKERGADIHRARYMYSKLIDHPRYKTSRFAAQAAEAVKNLGK